MDEETNKLLAKLELENGGKLEYRTYALYVGKTGSEEKNLGGLLYFVGEKLIFEDFERQNNGIMMLIRKKSEYIKLKFQISANEIERINPVGLSRANKVIKYNKDPRQLDGVSAVRRLFFRTITQILLKDGSAYYFEIFDLKQFMAFMANHMPSARS